MSSLNEKDSVDSIKDSIVATIKQTIADEEARVDNNNNNSFNSERNAYNAVLPEIDHEKSKQKINDLMFNPSDVDDKIFPDAAAKRKYLEACNKNGPENNLNDMPDLTTFDNRNSTAFNRLIGNKMRGQIKNKMPNNSMKNLNSDQNETLPIYKRRAKGPIKITESSYSNRPSNINNIKKETDKNTQKLNHSSDENINDMNQQHLKQKSKSSRFGRQQTDFRINRNKTVNGRRNPSKAAMTSWTNINGEQVQPESSHRHSKALLTSDKRAQSQHNTREKVHTIGNDQHAQSDIFNEIQRLKDNYLGSQSKDNLSYEDHSRRQPEESKEFLETEFTFQDKNWSDKKELEAILSQSNKHMTNQNRDNNPLVLAQSDQANNNEVFSDDPNEEQIYDWDMADESNYEDNYKDENDKLDDLLSNDGKQMDSNIENDFTTDEKAVLDQNDTFRSKL